MNINYGLNWIDKDKIDCDTMTNKNGYKDICEIGKERIRRVSTEISQTIQNKKIDLGFKIYEIK